MTLLFLNGQPVNIASHPTQLPWKDNFNARYPRPDITAVALLDRPCYHCSPIPAAMLNNLHLSYHKEHNLMALDLLIHTAAGAVLDYLVVEAGEGHSLADYLAHDPDKRSLQIALARTFHDFTQRHPVWVRDLLSGSALTGATAQTIGNVLRGAPAPHGDALAGTWVSYWNDVVTHESSPTLPNLRRLPVILLKC